MSIVTRPIALYICIVDFYVMISRVTYTGGLRLLRHNEMVLRNLRGLVWSDDFHAWDNGYNEQGELDFRFAIDALNEERAART